MNHINHKINPIYDKDSIILILGTFPSVKSREGQFFYHHPQNRFWKVLSLVMECEMPVSIEDKKAFLLRNRIAVWDVIASCSIEGSSDSSIQNVEPNDLNRILSVSDIVKIYTNGAKAFELYRKFCAGDTGREAIKLPSTSPANAAFSLDRLVKEWKKIKEFLD